MSEAAQQEAILPISERTRTIEVITRKVVTEKGVTKEIERPDHVFIRPLPFRRWTQAIGYITALLHHLPAQGINFNDNTELGIWIATLVGVADEPLFEVVKLATDKDPAFFDMIDADDGMKVIIAVVEVNKDFFTERVWPLIEPHLAGAKATAAEILGQTE